MKPEVVLKSNDDNTATFTLSNVNVSFANAIRRVILSDIPIYVFRTAPYEENKATIFTNTSRFNNEIVKQRLGCIPIHISDENFPYKNYKLEVNVENKSDTIMFVTTEDFIIKNIDTNKPIEDSENIFKPDIFTGYYIDFIRLRPRISDEIPGEKLHMTCDFDIGTAKEDGMYNVVSTCAYGNTVDQTKMDQVLIKKQQEWKDEGKPDIDFETKNWKLLDGLRITKPNSFDFIIQSVGIYTPFEIIDKSCIILNNRLRAILDLINMNKIEFKQSQTTMSNSFDIILEGEDYTIGKCIEYFLYSKYFENSNNKILTYCGFTKLHPHDTNSIIRVAYLNPVTTSTISGHLQECINDSIEVFTKIQHIFTKLQK